MEKQLIISITSWPPRINTLAYNLISIINQIGNNKLCLVLSEDEFPNKTLPTIIYQLLESIDGEIIWDKGNIKSHKKIIPVIEKYPDNDILILDDDKRYPVNLVKQFIESHKHNPNDIIVGGAFFKLVPKEGKIDCELIGNKGLINYLHSNQLLHTEKPANGCFGVLYPTNTFMDDRFFNRELLMSICPKSDETWQFLFNILEDRTLRCIENPWSIINNIDRTQNCALRIPPREYSYYNTQLLKYFPDFYEKLLLRYEQ